MTQLRAQSCRRLIFLSSHFAAHMEKLEERNADYAKIVRCLRFENTSATPPTSPRVCAFASVALFAKAGYLCTKTGAS